MTSTRAATAMSVLGALEERGIDYAVVRNYDEIPIEPGRDIDLLADMAARLEIERILSSARGEFGWESLVRCNGHHEGTSYYFLGPRRDAGGPDQLEIHFTRIRWAGATILGPADLIARRVRSAAGIWVAAPEHTVVQRVLQIGLSQGFTRMKESYWGELRDTSRSHRAAVVDALAEVLDDTPLATEAVELLINEDRSALAGISSRLRRSFLLAQSGRARAGDLPGIVSYAARKALGARRPARCGVVARVDPSTPEDVVSRLREGVAHMFLESRQVVLADLGQERFMAEAAEVVARAGLLIARAEEPFDSSFRWIPKVACWVPPDDRDAGVELVVRRFIANHRFL